MKASTIIHRPVSTVWDFYAIHYVENHPRWDPTLALEPTVDAPIGVGTVIKRRASRFGSTTEGIIKVIEFESERVMAVEIQDGQTTINGRVTFEAIAENETKLVLGAEFVNADASMRDALLSFIERSASNIKTLIESES